MTQNLKFFSETKNTMSSGLNQPSGLLSVIIPSLMVWRCISAYGMGIMHIEKGNVNVERHINVLEHCMLPSRQCLFQERPHIFQFTSILIASITMPIVARHFTETQRMTPKKISLTKIILYNPNQRKMASKKLS